MIVSVLILYVICFKGFGMLCHIDEVESVVDAALCKVKKLKCLNQRLQKRKETSSEIVSHSK